jgi:mRNA interferase RelE/StbE
MLTLDIKPQPANFIKDLPSKQCKQVYVAILELMKNPRPHDSEKLQGFDGLYRKNVGEYRIIYRFDNIHLFIILIGKRNDDEIYKALRNLKQ